MPDTLIVLIGRLLGLDGQNNLVFYTVVFASMLFASLVSLLRTCRLTWNSALVGALVTMIIFGFSGSDTSFFVAFPGIHEGILPLVSLSFALIAALVDKTWWECRTTLGIATLIQPRAWIACGLIAVTIASDAVAHVQLIAPALVGLGLILWRHGRLENDRRALPAIAPGVSVLAWGMIFGFLLMKLESAGNFFRQPTLQQTIHFARVFTAIKDFMATFLLIPNSTGLIQFLFLIAGFVVACAILLACVTLRPARFRQIALRFGIDTPGRLFCLSAIASSAIMSWAGPMVVGTYDGLALLRQQLPALLFGALLVTWLVLSQIERFGGSNSRQTRAATIAIGTLSSLVFLIPLARLTYTHIEEHAFPVPYLQAHKRVARLFKNEGLDFVLSGYWNAKPLIEASGWKLDVCPITPDLVPYRWIMNIDWCAKFYRDWSSRKTPLVVLLSSEDRDSFFKRNGMPVKEIELTGLSYASEAAVYDWSKRLEQALKIRICDSCAAVPLSKPNFCQGTSRRSQARAGHLLFPRPCAIGRAKKLGTRQFHPDRLLCLNASS